MNTELDPVTGRHVLKDASGMVSTFSPLGHVNGTRVIARIERIEMAIAELALAMNNPGLAARITERIVIAPEPRDAEVEEV